MTDEEFVRRRREFVKDKWFEVDEIVWKGVQAGDPQFIRLAYEMWGEWLLPGWKAYSYKTNSKGRYKDSGGYVRVAVEGHPFRSQEGLVAEHRLVMEQMLGRYLLPHENVHHKNGVRDDNSPENLELWSKPQPCGQRPIDLIRWIVEKYPAETRAILEVVDASNSLKPANKCNG